MLIEKVVSEVVEDAKAKDSSSILRLVNVDIGDCLCGVNLDSLGGGSTLFRGATKQSTLHVASEDKFQLGELRAICANLNP